MMYGTSAPRSANRITLPPELPETFDRTRRKDCIDGVRGANILRDEGRSYLVLLEKGTADMRLRGVA